jgi:hypothetical protein
MKKKDYFLQSNEVPTEEHPKIVPIYWDLDLEAWNGMILNISTENPSRCKVYYYMDSERRTNSP